MAFFDGKEKIRVVTHSGNFHADEVFAVATLSVLAEKEGKELEVARTRDENEFEKADILVDVGMKCEPENYRFDHHQKGGAGFHFENPSLPYASFGLVWKHFGEMLCDDKGVAERIEKKLVIPVDAEDNGVTISKAIYEEVLAYKVGDVIGVFNPTWRENPEISDERFIEVVDLAKKIILREIAHSKSFIEGEKITKSEIIKQDNPEILVLENYVHWENSVSESKNTKLVVYRHRNKNDWCVQSARDDLEKYDSDRAKMPEVWWGTRGEELQKISGIKDAEFCANAGFFAVAKSKESAIMMAKKALEYSQS